MAVVDTKTGNPTHAVDEDERRGKVIDPFAADLQEGVTEELNAEGDAWAPNALPPKGKYRLKVFPSAQEPYRGLLRDDNDPGSVYYVCNLECRIVSNNKDYDNLTVFGGASSRVGRGKDISTMAALLVKMGYKIPAKASDRQMVKLFATALKKEPVLWVDLDWQGYSKLQSRVVFPTMESFPSNGKGERLHQVTISSKDGGQEVINARLRIQRWYGAKELENPKEGPATSTGAGVGAASTGNVAPKGASAMPVEEELVLSDLE